ncbi:MAG: lysophospholipid acyltransferase family protein [Bacteroidetes bacterium]|nr:lysophospholipid acyltransferase family protein [Bacteroidota bacterium]
MQTLIFHIAFGFLYLLSLLPFWLLYTLSSFIRFVLFGIFKYRRNVIVSNLNLAFPDKTELEKTKIRKSFEQHFCDVFIESLKLLSISERNIKRRMIFDEESAELIEKYFNSGKMVLVVLGHYGNWEYMGPGFKLWRSKPLLSSYRPLSGRVADMILKKSRDRFKTIMVPMKSLTRELLRRKEDVCGVLLLADQSPAINSQHYWIKFFNHDTPVFQGAEIIARKLNTPVVFLNISKEKRGFYKAYLSLITDNPSDLKEGEITFRHTKMLENDIMREPAYWLWSHRRWKHNDKRGDSPLLFF